MDGSWSPSKVRKPIDKDGNLVMVPSTIAGFMEGQGGRQPYCRSTVVVRSHPEEWAVMQEVMVECARLYKENAPEKFEAQMAYVDKTDPAWVVDGSPYTTVTVNNHVAAAYHQDAGDLKDGMGCMMVFKRGEYRGFELVIPEYRMAVNMRHGDLVLFDPTIWHGNIPPFDESDDAERISVVMYYRKGIVGCLSPKEELDRAKNRGAL